MSNRPRPTGVPAADLPRGADADLVGPWTSQKTDPSVDERRRPALYDIPSLYDMLVPPGPCERFYRTEAAAAGGPVLELACGTGRLTVPLATAGHDVVGLDASPTMLAAARAKADSADAAITFVAGDMRHFDLGRRFALIVLSCNSLGHLMTREALVDCLRSVTRHLTPGGRFAFDVVNPNVAQLARSARKVVELDYGTPIVVHETAVYDAVTQVRTVHWHIAAPSEHVAWLSPLTLRQIFPQELPLLLEASGLRLLFRHGDFDRGPFCADSPNQICLAERAG